MHWVRIDALGEHWVPARVDAEIEGSSDLRLASSNVSALTLSMDAGWCPLRMDRPVQLTIDGQSLEGPRPMSDRSWTCALHRDGDTWRLGSLADVGLRKRHALQGPVDDAFMGSFLFVRPTGQSASPRFQQWAAAELEHATAHWRQQFRGDARIKDDRDVTDDDIAAHHLVLFGDPSSNALLARLADQLPVRWQGAALVVGAQQFAADSHAPILVYPNPLNRDRYVVLNSGFTFREFDYFNNARQSPKIPDWAIVDISQPVNIRYPGKIVAADFFDEQWQLKPRSP
jgi:hypothetical protein